MELDYIAIQDDSISFYRKVSSEINYDFLVFSVDNNELGSWSGEETWARESYPVSKGAHIFSWDYIKDYSLSNGSDCGWVDFILLPAYSDAVGISNIQAEQPSMVLFPNPASGKILVNYTIDNETEINICIYSSTGVPVISSGILNAETGTNQVELDLEGFAAGTYYCILSSGYWKVIRPLILLTGR
jgi:hypothetical protein